MLIKDPIIDSRTLRVDRRTIEESPFFHQFETVSVEDVPLNQFLSFDVYFPMTSDSSKSGVTFKKIVNRGDEFPAKLRNFFLQNEIKAVYVKKDEYEDFLNATLKRMAQIIENPYLNPAKKLEIVYRNAGYVTRMIINDPKAGKGIEHAQFIVEYYTRFVIAHQVSASLISKFFSKDYNLFAHSVQVAFLTIGFAHFIRQPVNLIPVIGIGAFLHDVGKAMLPAEIINKPAQLTEEEFKIITQHPQLGYDILKHHKSLRKDSLDIVIQHHERADGNGYPNGLKLHEINPAAQITHIVDCYDAMTMSRPYKEALSPFDTLKIMCTDMKESFNSKLLELFVIFLGY